MAIPNSDQNDDALNGRIFLPYELLVNKKRGYYPQSYRYILSRSKQIVGKRHREDDVHKKLNEGPSRPKVHLG